MLLRLQPPVSGPGDRRNDHGDEKTMARGPTFVPRAFPLIPQSTEHDRELGTGHWALGPYLSYHPPPPPPPDPPPLEPPPLDPLGLLDMVLAALVLNALMCEVKLPVLKLW